MERGISLLFLGFGLLILSVGFSMAYDVYPGHDQNFEGKYAIKNVTNVSMQCMTLNGVLSCDVNTLGNQSWNQALADTLYAKIIWNYNQTAPAIAYTNAVNASLASWINTNFLLKTDQRYNETSLILGINSTIWSELNLKLYATDQRYNETNLILGVNSSLWSYINANKDVWLSTYNSTYDATTRDVNANRSSWFSTYNATYATWAYNQTTATFNLYNSTWDNREIINSVNSSIWNYLSTFQGGNQSFNQTLTDSLYIHQSAFSFLQNWTGDQCPSGNYSYGYYQNGTPKCRDAVGGGSIVNFDNYTIIFSSTWGVNQSWINNTIDQRFVFLNGTIYTSDEVYINKLGTTFTFNQTKENIDIMALLNSVGIISQDIKSVNLTAATYAGNLTSGGLTGYDAANNICNLDYPGSHMCNEFEVTSYLAKVGENNFYTQTNDDAWVIAGGPKYVPAVTPVDDCMGFTNSEPTAVGNYWKYKTVNGGGKAINCQNDLKLSCCTIAPVNSSGGSANFTTDSYFLFDGSLLQMNTATLNATIDARQTGGGNASWNQGLADTLYYSITNPLNFINKTEADNYYEPLGGVGEMSQFTNDSNTIFNKANFINFQFTGKVFEIDNYTGDSLFKVTNDLSGDDSNVSATTIGNSNKYFVNIAQETICGIPGWMGGGTACGNMTGYNSTGDTDWQYVSEKRFNFNGNNGNGENGKNGKNNNSEKTDKILAAKENEIMEI